MRYTEYLLTEHPVEFLLALREQGEFPVQQYNMLFDRQLHELLQRVPNKTQRKQLATHVGKDWVGYIMRALRGAGFQDENEVEEQAHRLVVKLLLNPKGLFDGWAGQPIEARFKAAVTNWIASLIQHKRVKRKHFSSKQVDPEMSVFNQPPDRTFLIGEFVQFVKNHYGEFTARVLQQRLAGGMTKDMPGSRHAVKQAVRDIKTAAREFAARDPELLAMVEKAFQAERETIGKRFGDLVGV